MLLSFSVFNYMEFVRCLELLAGFALHKSDIVIVIIIIFFIIINIIIIIIIILLTVQINNHCTDTR